jgi:putative transposase
MIDRAHDLSISRQAKVLNISRGSVYYRPRPVSPEDLALMRRIDELHLERPFAGARMLRDFLNREGVAIGRRHVASLMKRMGIEAIYRRRNTSKPAPGHKIYPYLLRGVKIERPNQVWATDITYVPMARGFVYLTANAKRSSARRGRRLVHPARTLPSGVDHDGGPLLRRGAGRSHRQIRQA